MNKNSCLKHPIFHYSITSWLFLFSEYLLFQHLFESQHWGSFLLHLFLWNCSFLLSWKTEIVPLRVLIPTEKIYLKALEILRFKMRLKRLSKVWNKLKFKVLDACRSSWFSIVKKMVRLGWTVKCPESQTFWKSWQAVSKRILEFPDGLNFTGKFPCFHINRHFG